MRSAVSTPDRELVGVNEAAARLGVNGSTISRYLNRYPHLNRAEEGPPKVRLEELRQHRSENINIDEISDAPPPVGHPDGGGSRSAVAPNSPQSESPPRSNANDGYNRARATETELKAQRLRLKFAQEVGQLVPVDEVADAVAELGGALRDRLEVRARDIAEELAGETDARVVHARLRDSDRALLEWLSDEFAKVSINASE